MWVPSNECPMFKRGVYAAQMTVSVEVMVTTRTDCKAYAAPEWDRQAEAGYKYPSWSCLFGGAAIILLQQHKKYYLVL